MSTTEREGGSLGHQAYKIVIVNKGVVGHCLVLLLLYQWSIPLQYSREVGVTKTQMEKENEEF